MKRPNKEPSAIYSSLGKVVIEFWFEEMVFRWPNYGSGEYHKLEISDGLLISPGGLPFIVEIQQDYKHWVAEKAIFGDEAGKIRTDLKGNRN